MKARKNRRNTKPKFDVSFLKDRKFLIVISIPVLFLAFFMISPFSPFNITNIYISGNDVIKNFSLDSFDGEPLTAGGSVPSLGTKFNVETGGFWRIEESDVNIINIYESLDGTEAKIRYSVTAKNKINLFTNVRLDDVVSNNLDTTTETFLAGKWQHKGAFGDVVDSWSSNLQWTHYDFGSDFRTWNTAQNVFSGDLKASFDINPSPLPDIFTDADGNTIEKDFDYIAVDAVIVSDSIHGLMSNDIPTFTGLTPLQYDVNNVNNEAGAEPNGDTHSNLIIWDPQPTLSQVSTESIDVGVQAKTVGASLNPTTGSGASTWDPQSRSESMVDCEFTYFIGSISPLIRKYTSTLTYYEQDIITSDQARYVFPLGIEWYVRVDKDAINYKSETRDVGLHVTNRYIQAEIAITFLLYSSFTITPTNVTGADLQIPQEWYDELLWQMIIDGYGGGTQYQEPPEGFEMLNELLPLILTLVFIGVGIYVFIQVGMPLLLYRAGKRSGQQQKSFKTRKR